MSETLEQVAYRLTEAITSFDALEIRFNNLVARIAEKMDSLNQKVANAHSKGDIPAPLRRDIENELTELHAIAVLAKQSNDRRWKLFRYPADTRRAVEHS